MLELKGYVPADELQRFIDFIKTDSKQHQPSRWVRGLIIFGIAILVSLLVQAFLEGPASYIAKVNQWVFLLPVGLFLVSVLWMSAWIKSGGMFTWLKQWSGEYTWQINNEGISVSFNGKANFCAWAGITALVESPDAWHFYLRRNSAISIPKAVIDQPVQFPHFVANHWAKHPDNAGLALANSLAEGLTQKSFWSDLSSNLSSGLQLAFFAKTSALAFKVRTSQWVALVVFEVLLIAFFDYCTAGINASFNIYGLTEYSANYLLLILAVTCICYMTAAKYWFARLMVMLLAASIAMGLVYLPIHAALMIHHDDTITWLNWLVWGCSIIWVLLVFGRTIRLLFNYPLPKIMLLSSVYSFFVIAVAGVLAGQSFFHENYADAYAEYQAEKIDVEATYYKQPHLVSKALSQIKAERAGVADLYFIGLAGTSHQDVFKSEVNAAKNILDTHFDTANRSLLLVNHKDTVDQLPLANMPNLSASLDGLASKMNKEEDILFLFLSSHGSKPNQYHEDYEVSTSFYPLSPNNIEAKKLKSVLDQSGIKNRIIVISACYSGGFIDALKDENSLILTASRKDRNSFGCSNEAEYTYFGDAYFVQGLTATAQAGHYAINQAFDEAKKIISQKEKKLSKDALPSEPQRHMGSAMTEKLRTVEIRLQKQPSEHLND